MHTRFGEPIYTDPSPLVSLTIKVCCIAAWNTCTCFPAFTHTLCRVRYLCSRSSHRGRSRKHNRRCAHATDRVRMHLLDTTAPSGGASRGKSGWHMKADLQTVTPMPTPHEDSLIVTSLLGAPYPSSYPFHPCTCTDAFIAKPGAPLSTS